MSVTVDEVLSDRRARLHSRDRVPGMLVAAGAHLALLLLIWAAPRLQRGAQRPPEYVAVQIVPAQALGLPRAAPAIAKPVAAPQPKPAPSPLVPEPSKKSNKPEPKKTPVAAVTAPSPAAGPSEPSAEARVGGPGGAPAGTAALGAAVAQLDNPDFTYGYYVDQMLALIAAQWVRPPLGGGIEAVVHFEILADGEIRDVRIVTSSGYSSFDLAGLRAVQAASPLPPLPRSYRRDSLGVSLIIR